MRLPIGSPRDLPRELPWIGLTAAGLLAAFAFEHWGVHLLVAIPAAEGVGEGPPWAVAALVAPELVVLFLAGQKLRTVFAVVTAAGVGALLRACFHLMLTVGGAAGHGDATRMPVPELGLAAPVMGVAYLLVLGLAATAALDERRARWPRTS